MGELLELPTLTSNCHLCAELKIHGESCLDSLEYISSKKLICQTGSAVGRGKIVVTTLSGGDGTCTVSFCSLEPEPPTLLGLCTAMVTSFYDRSGNSR